MPTLSQIKSEVESGPLSAEFTTHWADVFGAVVGRPELDFRVGWLKPDAAFEIHRILSDPTKRTKLFPLPVAAFTTFLAQRGLLRKIKAVVANEVYPDPVRDICDLIVTVTAAAPDRVVDPNDGPTQTTIDALVTSTVATSADRTAFYDLCTGPCSRLTELGWSFPYDTLIEAKKVG